MRMARVPYSNYKTVKCKFFENDGQCKFGRNCSFAHGDQDLRKPYDPLPAGQQTSSGMPHQYQGGYEQQMGEY